MLKVRVVPTLLHRDFGLVKGVAFDSRRRIGSALQAIKVFNMRDVDELIFVDITATLDGRSPDYDLIDELADECFMPFTVGGGIRSVDHVSRLLQVGADRVSVNTAAVEEPNLVSEIARRFGSQSLVVSIDARRHPDGTTEVFTRSGSTPTGISPPDAARRAEEAGAGEILLTSVDRDGTMDGYDLELISSVTSVVSIPVIASGGAGNYEHLAAAVLEAGESAVGASAMFQFTEQTPREARHLLRKRGVPVRR